jgi:hypothetical protein
VDARENLLQRRHPSQMSRIEEGFALGKRSVGDVMMVRDEEKGRV